MRAIDLGPVNIFDFDAYGSPWEHVCILCARRRLISSERIGLILTEGSSLKVRFSSLPVALQDLTGMRGMPGLGKHVDMLINRAIQAMCARMRARVTKRWQAKGKTGAGVRYIGLVLEGLCDGRS